MCQNPSSPRAVVVTVTAAADTSGALDAEEWRCRLRRGRPGAVRGARLRGSYEGGGMRLPGNDRSDTDQCLGQVRQPRSLRQAGPPSLEALPRPHLHLVLLLGLLLLVVALVVRRLRGAPPLPAIRTATALTSFFCQAHASTPLAKAVAAH